MCALGALGRRFESCRPDWDLRQWQNELCGEGVLRATGKEGLTSGSRHNRSRLRRLPLCEKGVKEVVGVNPPTKTSNHA
jgi:hypothetical protein